jgi:putative transcriptional regulator
VIFEEYMELKNNLKHFRFNRGQVTQDNVARKLQVSRQTINAIENGKFNPSVKLALQIADFFKCSLEEIFYLEE